MKEKHQKKKSKHIFIKKDFQRKKINDFSEKIF